MSNFVFDWLRRGKCPSHSFLEYLCKLFYLFGNQTMNIRYFFCGNNFRIISMRGCKVHEQCYFFFYIIYLRSLLFATLFARGTWLIECIHALNMNLLRNLLLSLKSENRIWTPRVFVVHIRRGVNAFPIHS